MSFQKVLKDISSLKIQGAENIAEAAVSALANSPKHLVRKRAEALKKTRPTEPCMRNAINFFLKATKTKNAKEVYKELATFFQHSDQRISRLGARLIKNGQTIFTHCHSSTVVKAFLEAKKQKKIFSVHNTETRPLYQGRRTAKELAKAGIPCTMFVDSGARLAMKEASKVFLGCDAITRQGVIINKIGSEMICELAASRKIPVYVLTNSWKYDFATDFGFEEKIEQRHASEVWKHPPKGVKISNYAFEQIKPKLVKAILSELGMHKPKAFIKEVHKKYPFLRRK
jgi:ribose 1,5-bisphosphate isomerase